MNLLQFYLFTLIPLTSAAAAAATTSSKPLYAKPGCKDICGGIRIPYPFGIGPGCYINKWYAIDCNSSIPFLPAINNLKLLSVNLENQILTVNISMNSDCQHRIRDSTQILNVDLGESPFLFSRDENKFTVEGCGNAVILDQGNLLTGCSTICQNQTSKHRDGCYGVYCCQTTIDTTSLQTHGPDGVCGSAFLVDENSYSGGKFSRQSNRTFVPISLRWTLRRVDIDETECASMVRELLNMGNATAAITSYKCTCNQFEEGSPYVLGGCQRAVWQHLNL